jgi:hypothetical protein
MQNQGHNYNVGCIIIRYGDLSLMLDTSRDFLYVALKFVSLIFQKDPETDNFFCREFIMNKKIVLFLFSFFISSALFAQPGTASSDAGAGTFTRISKHQDYGLSVTRLVLDIGEGSIINEKDISGDTFTVIGSNSTGKSIAKIKGIAVTDVFGDTVEAGRYVTIDLDFGLETDSEGSISYTVTLNKDLGMHHKGALFTQKGQTKRR